MNFVTIKRALLVLAAFFPASLLSAADSGQLQSVFDRIYDSRLENRVYNLENLVIQYIDLEMDFDSGQFVLFSPVTIDSTERYYGGFYSGVIRVKYRPALDLERNQMRRFFEGESIDRIYENVTLLFGDELYQEIIKHLRPVTDTLSDRQKSNSQKDLGWLTKDENKYYAFWTLRSLIDSAGSQFLTANFSSDGSHRVFYIYNPFEREEVRLLKHYWYWHSGGEFMETVCSYSVYADETHADINGISKPDIKVNQYKIDAVINTHDSLTASVEMVSEVVAPSAQMLELFLHPDIRIDSVIDMHAERLAYGRYEKDSNKSRPLYIILDHAYQIGETIGLRFFYGGVPSKKYDGQLYVTPGSNWYPTTFATDRAMFETTFHTPKNLTLAAPGLLVDSRTAGDTLVTRWKIEQPARNISFSLGIMKKYEFKEEGLPLVEIYYDRELHKDIARNLSRAINPEGSSLEEHVAEDVINAMKLFTDYFGAYSYGPMRISEIMAMHGEAFPGFIHLGVPGWFKSDDAGYISSARAHEVAHQWWGVSVDYETYHDQWLSEGFAEYCGLMYVQAAFDNEKFLKQLREYRDNIFSIRKYLFSSGRESGPIAMGYRTLSTETPDDYGLIIYEKGAFCLHMLRNMMVDFKTMKEDTFFSMMTEFYNTYKGRSVSTADFRKITEKYFGMDMSWFFDQWVFGNDLPTYTLTYRFEKDDRGKYIAICNVITEGVGENFKMFVPLEIEIEKDNKVYARVLIEGTEFTFTLPGLPKIPRTIRLNPFESVLAKVKQ